MEIEDEIDCKFDFEKSRADSKINKILSDMGKK
jgi:hypothetical protein